MSSAETIEEVPDIDGDNLPRLTRALVGHHSQQKIFLSALNGQRMPHAWLMTGPKGVGKASFAYLAARAVVLCSGSGKPVEFTKFERVMPSSCARSVISSAKAGSLPAKPSASAMQASLPD